LKPAVIEAIELQAASRLTPASRERREARVVGVVFMMILRELGVDESMQLFVLLLPLPASPGFGCSTPKKKRRGAGAVKTHHS
jgi:hypothetical protein